MPEKLDIYSKIFFRDVENFFRYLCVLVLRHQMRVSNYFVNSFYSVAAVLPTVSYLFPFLRNIPPPVKVSVIQNAQLHLQNILNATLTPPHV